MAAKRPATSMRAPTVHADGFGDVSRAAAVWTDMTKAHGFTDITFKVAYQDMTAKIAINRLEVHNAFRPTTVNEMRRALDLAQDDSGVGVIVLAGEGTLAFCSGGDQRMRRCPKPIIAMVAGYAIGGGHILHMVADLTIAADNAVFGQTGPRVGSFDAGYGSTHMARIVGQKKAREMWFLCRYYSANEALDMGLVNTVVPLDELELETMKWCRRIVQNSPTAISCLKAALNADEDGQAGVMQLAGNATRLFYLSEEGKEGKKAFLEKRKPEFRKLLSSKL
eukprot:g10282.t1